MLYLHTNSINFESKSFGCDGILTCSFWSLQGIVIVANDYYGTPLWAVMKTKVHLCRVLIAI